MAAPSRSAIRSARPASASPLTLARELKRAGLRYGIASACIGGGQGIALLIENTGIAVCEAGQLTLMDIKGQARIVTGGASGLGAATARALRRGRRQGRGARHQLEAAPASVAKDIGGIAVECDVTDGRQRQGAPSRRPRQRTASAACWSIAPASARPSASSAATARCRSTTSRSVIEINLIGTFNMMRLFAADMQTAEPLDDGERGVIISTASVAAFEGQIGQAAYSSSKGGVVALTCRRRANSRSSASA